MRRVLADLPPEAPVWMAADGSEVERLVAHTSEDRGVIPVSNAPLANTPIRIGWSLSVVGLLPEKPGSWRAPYIQRVSSRAIEHLRLLKPLVGSRRVIVLANRWYATEAMLRACRALGDRVLIRRKSHRTLSRTPVRRSRPGAPPRDGPLLQRTRPETQTDPQAVWEATDAASRRTTVSRWDEVHARQERDLLLSVIRVERTSARDTTRDPRVRWFLTRADPVPLEQVPASYGLRFSEKHGFRFLKQERLWAPARGRTPDHVLPWRWMVALAFIPLSVARALGLHALVPWEARGRPLTPRQVRRVMPSIVSQVGTPTHPCQPRGRARGFRPQPALRHPVVERTGTTQKKHKTAPPTCVRLASAVHVNGSFSALNHPSSGSAKVTCV